MPKLFVLLLILVLGKSAAASDAADIYLPPPEKLLASIISFGPQNDADVFGSIEGFCNLANRERLPNYCSIPSMVTAYKKLSVTVFGGGADVDFAEPVRLLSPWDLRHLIAGGFMTLPDRTGESDTSRGLQNVVSLFVMRSEIVSELKKLKEKSSLLSVGRPRDVRQVVLIPSLEAYIQSSTPLGAMIRAYESIHCSDNETLCRQLRSKLGSAIDAVARPHAERLTGFQTRMMAATDETAPERLRRLRLIGDFATKLNVSERTGKPLSRDEVESRLKSLVDDGQGFFGDEGYQNVARTIVSVVEAMSVVDQLETLSQDRGALSPLRRAQAATALNPIVKDSIDSVERALQIFAIKEDNGELGL